MVPEGPAPSQRLESAGATSSSAAATRRGEVPVEGMGEEDYDGTQQTRTRRQRARHHKAGRGSQAHEAVAGEPQGPSQQEVLPGDPAEHPAFQQHEAEAMAAAVQEEGQQAATVAASTSAKKRRARRVRKQRGMGGEREEQGAEDEEDAALGR